MKYPSTLTKLSNSAIFLSTPAIRPRTSSICFAMALSFSSAVFRVAWKLFTLLCRLVSLVPIASASFCSSLTFCVLGESGESGEQMRGRDRETDLLVVSE